MISANELREKQFKDYEKEIAQEQQIIRISDELITDPHFLSDVDALVEKRSLHFYSICKIRAGFCINSSR